MSIPNQNSTLSSRLEAECAAIDTFAKWRFDQHLIHVAGEEFDAIPSRAAQHVPSDFADGWRDLMNRYNDPDTREGSLSVHPELKHVESQALYQGMVDSPDWSAYLHFTQSQSQPPQPSQGNSQGDPAPNQQQQQQKQLRRNLAPPAAGQLQLQLPVLRSPGLQPPSSPRSSRERSTSPRRSGRTSTTPSRFNNFVIEKETDAATDADGRGRKRKASLQHAEEDSDSEEDSELPNAFKRIKHSSALSTTLKRNPPPASPNTVQAQGRNPNQKQKKARPPAPRARASAEEASQLAAASKDPETDMSDDEPILTRPPLSASAAPAQVQAQLRAFDPVRQNSASTGDAGQRPGISLTGMSKVKAKKVTSRWITYPPPSTSTRAETGTRRTDRSMIDRSKGVPQQKSGDALFEHNIKLSQPAVDSLFGAPLSAGYDGFEFYNTFLDDDNTKKEWWVCLKCGDHKTASRPGSSSNLKHHGSSCKGLLNLSSAAASDTTDEADVDKAVVVGATRPGHDAASVTTSYSGLGVVSWLSGSHSVNLHLTRRRAVLLIIRNALAFRLLSTMAFKDFVRSMDVRMTLALKSHQTVRRDIAKIFKLMKRDVRSQIHGADTLISLQHDAWTNKGFQHSFIVVLASWVDSGWKYREMLLSFDVVDDRHTGATFAGHVVRTLQRFDVDKKWFGPVVSDSTGTNHRLLDLLELEIASKGMQQRQDRLKLSAIGDDVDEDMEAEKVSQKLSKQPGSISAFPDASLRQSGKWRAPENKILCMNHHINLAVRAGFATFSVKVQTKTQRKILQIHPAVVLQDVEGQEQQLLDQRLQLIKEGEEEDDGADISFEEEEEDEEDGEWEGEERYDGAGQDEESDSDDGDDSGVDVDEKGPEASELLEDDGGGPGAEDVATPTTSRRDLNTAIGRLEGFVSAVSRSDLRKKAFRRAIEKEYLYDPDPQRSSSPIPPKPNATRWNSHLAMLEAALKVKEAIDQHCRAKIGTKDDIYSRYLLSDQHWAQLEALQPLLALAQDITKELEAAEGTLCLVLDHHACLRDEIEGLQQDVETLGLDKEEAEQVQRFLAAMGNKLRHYRELALKNRLTVVAAILHPMHRLRLFEEAYPGHQRNAEKLLRQLVEEIFGDGSSSAASATTGTVGQQGNQGEKADQHKPSRVAVSRRKRQQKAAACTKKADDKPDEITKYLNPSNCAWRESDTPYKWWKDNEGQFPMLAKVARIVLGIPGSSSSSERVFSQAALYSTNRRARLTASAIGQLVSVKNWLTNGADPLIGLSVEARQTAAVIARIQDPKA